MANIVKVYVETPDEILDPLHSGAGAVVQLQRDTVEAFSTPADVDTAAIVTQVRAYTIFDPGGGSASWYRTRYETSGGAPTSDWSTPFQVGIVGYCSLDDVKQRLERTGDTTDDELFAEYIDEATDYMSGYIGRSLIDTALTHTFDGYDAIHGGRCLLVPRGVRSLSLVETSATTGGSFEAVTATDYLLRPTTQERSPGWPATELWLVDNASLRTFPRGYANVRLTGEFGFSPIPRRIEEVALNLVVRMYASRQAGQSDMLGAGGDGGQPIVSSFLSRRDRDTLDKFTPMQVA
jgi:hypothetical protein